MPSQLERLIVKLDAEETWLVKRLGNTTQTAYIRGKLEGVQAARKMAVRMMNGDRERRRRT